MTGEGTMPLLSVRNLQTHFFADEGVTKAVDGASFEVYPGKTLGIVGESGCGKSVTARSILRIVEHPGRIVGGEVILREGGQGLTLLNDTVDMTKLPPNGAEMRAIRGNAISLIFQEPMTSFSPVHTIGNQIIEAIRIHRRVGKAEARDRAVELLRRVGISRPEARLDEYAFQLSGGLRQRAMIAMALSCDPVLLIADEPTTALDVTTQAQILELLKDLQEQNGMAIILITHNLGVVAETADDVVVMYLGRAVEQGPVDAIFYEPKHPYTKALLRSIPSVDAPPRVPLPTISGTIPHPFNRPRGCPFHPRCPSFMPGTCEMDEPEMREVGPDQAASCFLYPPAKGPWRATA
jgi:oligopeptide/dipeptide ABC transporter ATP-binding protein